VEKTKRRKQKKREKPRKVRKTRRIDDEEQTVQEEAKTSSCHNAI